MATEPVASARLRFDDFEFDVRAGLLRRQGVRLRLRGQPLQVLEILLEKAGDVVTREELESQIWPNGTFVDFDHSLHNAIARIREVLGDSAGTRDTLRRCLAAATGTSALWKTCRRHQRLQKRPTMLVSRESCPT